EVIGPSLQPRSLWRTIGAVLSLLTERQRVPQRSPPFPGRSSKPASFIFCLARRSSRQTNTLASLGSPNPLAILPVHLGFLGSSEYSGRQFSDDEAPQRAGIGL